MLHPPIKTMNYIPTRDRGPGGIRPEHFPWYARSALVHNARVRSLSHGEVSCHRSWTFPFVYQSSHPTPTVTVEPLASCIQPFYVRCTVKCPMTRLQRYSTLQKPISLYQPQVGLQRVALIDIAVRTSSNNQAQHLSWSVSSRPKIYHVY